MALRETLTYRSGNRSSRGSDFSTGSKAICQVEAALIINSQLHMCLKELPFDTARTFGDEYLFLFCFGLFDRPLTSSSIMSHKYVMAATIMMGLKMDR